MAIPVQTQVFWRMLSTFGGASMFQLGADRLQAAREQRRRLIALPGATVIVGRPHPDVHIIDKSATAADGRTIPIRVYRPRGTLDEVLPVVMNFHGGGFVSGDPRQSEWWCSHVAAQAHAVVVSVAYRLAPEHPFPAAPEDCYAATQWTAQRAGTLGADGSRLAVMGDSAGGNLAAVVALLARDRGGPPIALQVLIYPSVEYVRSFPSEEENANAPMLTKQDLQIFELYCPDNRTDPYAAPLRAAHENLPPALIQTAQHDPIRDQGTAYAEALQAAGVQVQLTNYVDGVHGYVSIPGAVPCARQALTEAAAALRKALS
jgi:acetyl esterase